ncbi:CpsD/CapB family tyrosine-protein kinase [Roseomonas fluvialis]|uniref:Chromosome partitioning protein n=1 Tax=Roseomonas fluvialis TaxID=1750527 RepID=A0ABM7Y6C8_9PROT|nr:CpsD/CapB family tyrosine-protein kinase [Roseomonas fluvialis]BDG73476.1 chromosome partitioning protein [Roseomonas fluvialis]
MNAMHDQTALAARAAATTGGPLDAAQIAMMPVAVSMATGTLAPQRVIALVSSLRREGTTTVAMTLARTLQMGLGRSVALVDANLVAPALGALHGIPPGPGLAEVLGGRVPLRRALHVAASGQFAILPSGNAAASEQGSIFAASSIGALCQQIRREGFDFCVIDCPAVLASPEAAMVGAQAGSAMMVVRAESTAAEVIREAAAVLEAGGAPLAGTLLNRYRRHLPAVLDRLL